MFGRRLVLAALLALAGAPIAACGKGDAAAVAVVPGKAAGTVLEVSGTVTATRPGAPARSLTQGDTVSGDDEITTGADGSVLIELDHNHVTFTLPAGRTQRVAASLAWSQPIAAARTAATDEHSAAAGRAIERSAVDTSASSVAPPAVSGAPVAPTAPPMADPPAEPAKAQKRDPSPPKPVAPPPPPPPPPEEIAIEGGTATAADTESMPAPAAANSDKASRGRVVTDGLADDDGGGAAATLKVSVKGSLTEADVRAAITPATLAACSTQSLRVTIVVDITGKLGRITTSGDRAATTCVRSKLAAVKLAAKPRETTITLTVN